MKMTLRTLFVISLCHLASGVLTFNQTIATDQCKGHGGLASYQHFIENDGRSEDKGQSLREGDSAWISGNVKFSNKFVVWYGCFIGEKQEIWKYHIANNNIYNCLEYCSGINDKLISYIGLRKEWCYCIKSTQIGNIDASPDKFCKKQFIEPNIFSRNVDSSTSTINIYSIIERGAIFWGALSPDPFGQCVYSWKKSNKIRYMTDSCFTLKTGFICVNSVSHPQRTNCSAIHNDVYQSPIFCAVYMSSSWPSAYKQCNQILGKLVPHIYPEIQVRINPNVNFWTGIFRSFKLDDADVSEKNRVCLSLKKVDNKLVLDPANCSTNKRYICEDSISGGTGTTTLKTTYSHEETESEPESTFLTTTVSKKHTVSSVTFFSSPTTMLSKDKETSDGETVHTSIYIATGVVLTLIFAIVIIITCLILRKRRKVRKSGPYNKTRSKDDHKTAAADSDINARSATVSHCVEQSQVLIHQRNESAEDCAYATPHKALIQRNVPECEYDRVDLNAPRKSTDNAASAMPVDANVYGIHSGIRHDDETGEYDHLHAVGTKQLEKPMDGIYNITSAVNDTYNVLTSESKGKSTDRTIEKRPHMDETCATYDKLD